MASNIYTTLISNLKTTLESISEVNVVYSYPVSRVRKYPAVIFIPSSYESDFDSNQENMEIRSFRLVILVSATQTNLENVFTDILPKVVDAVRDKIASDWNGGNIDGHRVWYKMDSGDWAVNETQDGLEAWAEFNLDIKLLTNN